MYSTWIFNNVYLYFTGSSDDWAKGKAGIKYSYTIELPDKGIYGFLLPADKIVQTGREIFTGIKSIAKSIVKIYNTKNKSKSKGWNVPVLKYVTINYIKKMFVKYLSHCNF